MTRVTYSTVGAPHFVDLSDPVNMFVVHTMVHACAQSITCSFTLILKAREDKKRSTGYTTFNTVGLPTEVAGNTV